MKNTNNKFEMTSLKNMLARYKTDNTNNIVSEFEKRMKRKEEGSKSNTNEYSENIINEEKTTGDFYLVRNRDIELPSTFHKDMVDYKKENLQISESPNKHLIRILEEYNKKEMVKSSKFMEMQNESFNDEASSKQSYTEKQISKKPSNSNIMFYMKNCMKLKQTMTLSEQINKSLFNSKNRQNNIHFPQNENNGNGIGGGKEVSTSIPIQPSKTMNKMGDSQSLIIQTSDQIQTVKNCNDIVKKIGEKISDLKVNLIKEDIRFRLDANKLTKNLKNFLNILYFLNGDLYGLYKSSRKIHETIKNYLINEAKVLVTEFKKTSSKYFKLTSSSLIIEKNINNKLIVNLVIKSQLVIPEALFGKSFTVSYNSAFEGNKNVYKNLYKFDYKNKISRNKIWIMKEFTNFHVDEFNRSFIQPIFPFSKLDTFQISVNIITERGFLCFNSFKWFIPTYMPSPLFNPLEFNEKHKYKEIAEFDLSRICELELIKNKWIEFNKKIKNNYEIEFFSKKFEAFVSPQLHMSKLLYDDIGFFLFKLYFVANEEGICYNKELGINIVIKNSDDFCLNEIKKNCLIFDRSNTLELRIGDEIIFYISQNKSNY